MKLETITINMMQHTLSHLSSTDYNKVEFEKKGFGPGIMKYVEDYCTKNGFEIINAETPNNMRIYHLIKK